MSREQAVVLIVQLRNSEVSKSRCGKRLIAYYDAQQK